MNKYIENFSSHEHYRLLNEKSHEERKECDLCNEIKSLLLSSNPGRIFSDDDKEKSLIPQARLSQIEECLRDINDSKSNYCIVPEITHYNSHGDYRSSEEETRLRFKLIENTWYARWCHQKEVNRKW